MSALIPDVLEGNVSPSVANAVVNAGGKLLKAAEMQIRYGHPDAQGRKILHLTGENAQEESPTVLKLRRIASLEAEIKALTES